MSTNKLLEGINKLRDGNLEGRALAATQGWVANLIKTLSTDSPSTLKDIEVRAALKSVEPLLDAETLKLIHRAESDSPTVAKTRGRKPQIEGQVSERQQIYAFVRTSERPVSVNEIKEAFPNIKYPSSHLNNLKEGRLIKHSKENSLYWYADWDGSIA